MSGHYSKHERLRGAYSVIFRCIHFSIQKYLLQGSINRYTSGDVKVNGLHEHEKCFEAVIIILVFFRYQLYEECAWKEHVRFH